MQSGDVAARSLESYPANEVRNYLARNVRRYRASLLLYAAMRALLVLAAVTFLVIASSSTNFRGIVLSLFILYVLTEFGYLYLSIRRVWWAVREVEYALGHD